MTEVPLQRNILVVDDEVDIRESMRDLLEACIERVKVTTAASGPEGLEVLGRGPTSLVLVDYLMPEMDGLAFLAHARRVAPSVPCVLMTAYPQAELAMRALNEARIKNFITKPVRGVEVLAITNRLLQEQEARSQESVELARSLHELGARINRGPPSPGAPR